MLYKEKLVMCTYKSYFDDQPTKIDFNGYKESISFKFDEIQYIPISTPHISS